MGNQVFSSFPRYPLYMALQRPLDIEAPVKIGLKKSRSFSKHAYIENFVKPLYRGASQYTCKQGVSQNPDI